MIKKKTVEQTTKIQLPEEYICDKCGRTHDCEDVMEVQEFHFIRFTGGYNSVFGDETMVECDICQHCLKAMIGDIARTA